MTVDEHSRVAIAESALIATRWLHAIVVVLIAGCGSVPQFAASGEVAGYTLQGPVDHPIAREYLEQHRWPDALARVRDELLSSTTIPSSQELRQLSQSYSPDVATLLLLEALAAQPRTRDLRSRYERELAHVQRVGVEQAVPDYPSDLLVLLVPGWFYVSHGEETNADFRIQRKLYEHWAVPHQLVPIDENGSVEANARIVADTIRATSNKRLFVVSASKSGAEVATALGRELSPSDARSVVGWLSIVGVVRGSPLADRMLQADVCWLARGKLALEGFGLEGLQSMRTSSAQEEFSQLRFPAHIDIFSVVAVPLSGNVSERGQFGYARMRELGPNDGLTLLHDELIPGSTPLLLTGVDHFLGDEQQVWSTALFRALVADL